MLLGWIRARRARRAEDLLAGPVCHVVRDYYGIWGTFVFDRTLCGRWLRTPVRRMFETWIPSAAVHWWHKSNLSDCHHLLCPACIDAGREILRGK